MRFDVDHEFPAAPAVVASVLLDPRFHEQLELPDLSRPDILDATPNELRMRYRFVGHLDPVARRLLAGKQLAWIQTLRLDTTTLLGTLEFAAEADADRLNGQAGVALTAINSETTRRRISGELRVHVPLIGPRAERSIVPGLVRRLDVEAAALADRVRPTSP